jgi:hypothetical protein
MSRLLALFRRSPRPPVQTVADVMPDLAHYATHPSNRLIDEARW